MPPWTMGLAALASAILAGVALKDYMSRRSTTSKVFGVEKPPSAASADQVPAVQPTPRGRVYVEGGVLYGPIGDPYRLTDDDLLWLARAIVGETGGGDRRAGAAVSWALAQNWKLVRRSTPIHTFTGIVRAYCQPVNPIWESATSSGCMRQSSVAARGTAQDPCSPARLARRRQIRTMQWSQLPAATLGVVEDFRDGRLENPVPGLVDWSAPRFDGASVEIGGNWFGIGRDRRLV